MSTSTGTSTTGTRPKRAVHPVDEVLPPQQLAIYGFQHVMAFYAGAIIVPILLANAIGLNEEQLIHLIQADLFTCGIASILQAAGIWKIGVRLPLLQGVTFTAVSPMIVIGLDYGADPTIQDAAARAEAGAASLPYIYGAVIVAGLFTLLIAPFFSKLVRFFPPVVTGSVITIIGVALLPVAAYDAGGGVFAFYNPDLVPANLKFGSLTNLALAFGTITLILLVTRFGRGFLATVAVLIGLSTFTALAAFIPDGSGGRVTDFSGVGNADVVGFTAPFFFGAPKFAVLPILLMVVVMLITAVETTGDVYATGQIVEKTIKKSDIAAALRADGIATALGGVMNSFPYTCFAENVGLVRLTRVKSRWVVVSAGVIMMILGLIPKAGAVVEAIPHSVLGGAALVMFGTVAAVGIQTLGRADLNDHRNVVVVATSLGVAMLPVGTAAIGGDSPFFDQMPSAFATFLNSGITAGSAAAILLNLVLNYYGGRRDEAKAAVADIRKVNEMSKAEFVALVSPSYQGEAGIAEKVADRRPFADANGLRAAMQDELFALSTEEQTALMRSYPTLAGEDLSTTDREDRSFTDQAAAGLTFLGEEEAMTFGQINVAYREKFGIPLIVAARELSSDQVLEQAWQRLDNSPTQEHAAALLEIAKIANHRLADSVADTAPLRESGSAKLQRTH